jgi:hypothetical protein
MKIEFSPKETGACPLCRKHQNCTMQNSIRRKFDGIREENETPLELVIYVCPYFDEKA